MPGIVSTPPPQLIRATFVTDGGAHDEVEFSSDLHDAVFQSAPAPFYAAIKLLGSSNTDIDLFQTFKTFKVGFNGFLPPRTVQFRNNLTIARFCADQCTVDSALVLSVEKPLPLSSIIVSTPEDVYDILAARESRESVVRGYLGLDARVVGTGHFIRELSSEVVMCDPIGAGIITETTEITIVKQRELHYDNPSEDSEGWEADVSGASDFSDLSISSYLSLAPHTIATGSAARTCAEFHVGLLHTPVETDFTDDPEFCGFVNVEDLGAIGCFSGDVIQFKIGEEVKFMRIRALVEPVHRAYRTQKTIYISPIWFYNLGKPELFSVGSATSEALPVAKSITLARVASPVTLDKAYQQSFLSELKSYFEKSLKVVSNGDMVPIPIDTLLAKTMFESTPVVVPSGVPDAIAWFQVTDVDGSHARAQVTVDPARTKMIQSGTTVTKLPDNESTHFYEYLNMPRRFNFNGCLSQCFPIKKFGFAREFKKILQTTFNVRINMKTSIILSSSTRGLGKSLMVHNMALELGANLLEIECYDVLNVGNDAKTLGTLRGKIDRILSECLAEAGETQPGIIIYLKHLEALCKKTDQQAAQKDSLSLKVWETFEEWLESLNVAVVASVNDMDKLSDVVRNKMKFQVELGVPSEAERMDVIKFLLEPGVLKGAEVERLMRARSAQTPLKPASRASFVYSKRIDVSFQALALQSAGLTPRDLISIVDNTKSLALARFYALAQAGNTSIAAVVLANGGFVTLAPVDFEAAINDARNKFSDSIGAPRIPNVKWEDIGGLDLVKDEILDTIDMPLKHPELFANGIKKRSGILFYGPPGTGKTLLAKAIATNFSLNFFSVKGPELLNMYIGESEANVRRVFQRARDAKPCVVFFDELDSVAPKRGNQGDSGGVMDRIVSQLLAELDGMSGGDGGDGVFVVGATNRPDLLDEALLRPGRFDKMLYLGISDTHEKQQKILEALTRKFPLDPKVDLERIAQGCPYTFTGADFYALCSDSMLNAMTRTANQVDTKITEMNKGRAPEDAVSTRWWFDNVAKSEDVDVLVSEQDFTKARGELIPSVSAEELEHYLRVRQNFEGIKEKAKP
ncbi:hypothetical protein BABINDRAFT_163642 [Babjeviella inositovora NRRL Y-12698]|uniref:Peroxisomal ATPase PEX6 n=1 Tax=Babjeviella inositovora NRRL Y-12698 TaxID=984486 RepID=A0A1E3QK71_9ASCO|nr:uncharacterized protein BABINDRAFT_163642 [Babjeviella inositovora NRRL Y-12698]ODQ77397.1 hypothetical protein BABINDRAFT_163642 [Babjeviella inositovora NRRL Y-12698]